MHSIQPPYVHTSVVSKLEQSTRVMQSWTHTHFYHNYNGEQVWDYIYNHHERYQFLTVKRCMHPRLPQVWHVKTGSGQTCHTQFMFDPCISHYSNKPKIHVIRYLWFDAVVRNTGIKHKLGVTCLATSDFDMSHLRKLPELEVRIPALCIWIFTLAQALTAK